MLKKVLLLSSIFSSFPLYTMHFGSFDRPVPLKNRSQEDKELIALGAVYANAPFHRIETIIQSMETKISPQIGVRILQKLTHKYENLQAAPKVLQLLVQQGVDVNSISSLEHEMTLLHEVTASALDTGNVRLLESFLKSGANAHYQGKQLSPYDCAFFHAVSDKTNKQHYKTLATFIRCAPLCLSDKLQKKFGEVISVYNIDDEDLKKQMFMMPFEDVFFSMQEPEIIHTIILANLIKDKKVDSDQAHRALLYFVSPSNENSGKELIYFNILVKLGAPLNKTYEDGQTILHKVTELALATKQTDLFEEAVKNGADINEKGQTVESPFEMIQKANNSTAAKLLELLKENNLIN